jgi:hypothetical protein
MGLPAIGWSTFGKAECMRLPCPAARMTTDIPGCALLVSELFIKALSDIRRTRCSTALTTKTADSWLRLFSIVWHFRREVTQLDEKKGSGE